MNSITAYEKYAHEFLSARDRSRIGCKTVATWAQTLPRDTEIMEIACGGGYPITRILLDTGCKVWALDSSPTLLATFQTRFPEVPTQCESVLKSNFFGKKFNAAIAIGLLFLLPEKAQIAVINSISRVLLPKGRLLFTAPLQTGRWQDMNTGLECVSLGYEKYAQILHLAGFTLDSTFEDSGKNNYYAVTKGPVNTTLGKSLT